tara:strand:- start:298 stop:1437 length:1140 start_codon:yes stop_codon:yes gene_type:complete
MTEPFRLLDLFSGIGGFSLGLERVKWPDGSPAFQTEAFCEKEEFPSRVLAKHWPDVPIYEDIKELTNERLKADGIIPNAISAGWPCQDFSVAGKQAGFDGSRSSLWHEIIRLVTEINRDSTVEWIILENVAALPNNSRWMGTVLSSLSQIGYDAEWHCIPASTSVHAPHRRDRIFIIAYPNSRQYQGTNKEIQSGRHTFDDGLQNLADTDSSISDGRPDITGRETKERTATGWRGEDVADTESITIGAGLREGEPGEIGRRRSGDGDSEVAYPDKQGLEGRISEELPERTGKRPARQNGGEGYVRREFESGVGLLAHGISAGLARCEGWLEEPGIGRVATGIPDRRDKLMALGNSLVPAIPELIGNAIVDRLTLPKDRG